MTELPEQKPLCLYCGKPLQRFDGSDSGADPSMQWGDYGDNHFCDRACGHAWSIAWLRRSPHLAASLHTAMINVMRLRAKAKS